jgi:hypothetical protein
MDDVVLRRSLEVVSISDPIDDFYGDQELQIDLHNGEVSVTFEKIDLLLNIINNLNTNLEGAGNYIIFLCDRVIFISDAQQLGVQQYVEMRPEPDLYNFIPGLNADTKRTSRVILKTRFTNIKMALMKDKASKVKRKGVKIVKKRGKPDLDFYILTDKGVSSPHTISCAIISHPPERPDGELDRPLWKGSPAELINALSVIISGKADSVYTYIKTDGKGIYFYAYHATSGHGSRGSIGDVNEEDFKMEDKNIKLTPKSPLSFITYKLSRKGLKTLQKLSTESPGELSLHCISNLILRLECSIDGDNNTHTYYFQ